MPRIPIVDVWPQVRKIPRSRRLGGVVRKLIAHLSLWHSWAHPTQQSVAAAAAMVKTAIPITSSDVFFKVETLLFQSA